MIYLFLFERLRCWAPLLGDCGSTRLEGDWADIVLYGEGRSRGEIRRSDQRIVFEGRVREERVFDLFAAGPEG